MSIVVVGSLNIDRFSTVARLPRPGETVIARGSFTRFGGKGANQAVAAARLGAKVALIGAIGADDAGRQYRQRLAAEGIEARLVEKGDGVGTGMAAIALEDGGENVIIVDPGANARLTAADVRAFRDTIAAGKVVVVQLEIPLEAVLEVIRVAQEAGVALVLNPSPWRQDVRWRELELHTAIVNEKEAQAWSGEDGFEGARRIRHVVITRGADSTVGLTADGRIAVSPPRMTPVDTVGAGDAFTGAYAVATAEGMAFKAALRFANAAGALATQKAGAQESLPDRAAVLGLVGTE